MCLKSFDISFISYYHHYQINLTCISCELALRSSTNVVLSLISCPSCFPTTESGTSVLLAGLGGRESVSVYLRNSSSGTASMPPPSGGSVAAAARPARRLARISSISPGSSRALPSLA